MQTGERAMFTIASNKAYGEHGQFLLTDARDPRGGGVFITLLLLRLVLAFGQAALLEEI